MNKYSDLFLELKNSKNPMFTLVAFLKQSEKDFKQFVLENIPKRLEGKPGKTPTETELVALMQRHFPKPPNNKPTRDELIHLIRPLIPPPKEPEPISDYRLQSVIKPLIPKVENGKDAVVDYTKIRDLVFKEVQRDYHRITEMVLAEIKIPAQIPAAEMVRMINKLPLLPEQMIDASHIKGLSVVVPMGGGVSGPSAFRGIGLWSTPPEVVSATGSVTAFTVGSVAPTDVIADGIVYYLNNGYTYSAATGKITFDIGGAGPTQYVRYR